MIKIALKYALFCGVLHTIIFWISDRLGINPLIDIRHLVVDALVFFTFIFFACKEFKTYDNENILHFWQGLNIGIVTLLVSTILSTFLIFIYIISQEGFLLDYREELLRRLIESKADLISEFGEEGFESIKTKIAELSLQNILVNGVSPPSILLKKILIGFFVTPIASIILRKKPF